MSKNLNPIKQLIDTVYPSVDALDERLKKGNFRIYYGIDPTGPVVHLGHAVPLRVLAYLQQMGAQVVLVFGDFTAMIGDPTGRDKTRSVLDRAIIEQNVSTYKDQIAKILDVDRAEIKYNSKWYGDADKAGSLEFLLDLGKDFTASQLWERDMFQERQQKGEGVTITEFLYPVLQAYDSVALEVDGEVGGTDQTFNMLRGRDLSKRKLGKDKIVITTKLLVGTDGRKMSKSFENHIALTDKPSEMFGKLMSVKDELIGEYFELAGMRSVDEELSAFIKENPREAKAQMAREVVELYWSSEQAINAEFEFNNRFRDGQLPDEILEAPTSLAGEQLLGAYLVDVGLAKNKSEASRLISQGGVKVDGVTIANPLAVITASDGMLLQVGKRKFVKVRIANNE